MGGKFIGNCLTEDNVSFTHINLVIFFIVWELDTWATDSTWNNSTLAGWLLIWICDVN